MGPTHFTWKKTLTRVMLHALSLVSMMKQILTLENKAISITLSNGLNIIRLLPGFGIEIGITSFVTILSKFWGPSLPCGCAGRRGRV